MQLGSLIAPSALALFLLSCSPVFAADPDIVKIKLEAGNFVLEPANIKITKGQSIKWVPVEKDPDLAAVIHHLVPKTPDDAFKETGEFNNVNPPTQEFEKVGEINYFCTRHPGTMIGTIKVEAAETGK
jgi:plastocyanin